MSDLITCKRCGVVATEKYHNSCPVCDHQGRKFTYADGTESRHDWWENVK